MKEKINIRVLGKDDIFSFIELVKLFEVVFEMKDFVIPDEAHLSKLLKRDGFEVIIAELDSVIVGGLTLYVLEQYYSPAPLAYIYDLAVSNELQRQGIGQKLIAFTRDYYKKKGFEEVFVQADKVDDYALRFYRKTEPTEEEDVSHFYYHLH